MTLSILRTSLQITVVVDDYWNLIYLDTDFMHSYRKYDLTIKNRPKKLNLEKNSLIYSLVSKMHMHHVTNTTIVIFNQLAMEICIFGENLKLIALFFPKVMNNFLTFVRVGKFGRSSKMESSPYLNLQI